MLQPLRPTFSRDHALQQEKLPKLESSPHSSGDPAQPKISLKKEKAKNLRRGGYPVLPRWARYNYRDPYEREVGGSKPEKEMVTHSSILAWKIPWMEKPGRLQSMGSQRVGHN